MRVVLAVVIGVALLATTFKAWQRLQLQDADLSAQIASLRDLPNEISAAETADRLARADQLERSRLRFQTLGWKWIACGTLIYAIGLLPTAIYFWRILVAFGFQPRPQVAIAAHIIGHLGKYVPGKALVVILRAASLRSENIPFGAAAIAAIMETLSYMAIGAMFAGLATLLIDVPPWIQALAAGLTVLTLVPTLPPIFRPIIRRLWLRKRAAANPESNLSFASYSWSLTFVGWGLLAVTWLATGTSFWCMLRALPGDSQVAWHWHDNLLATGAISLAVVAGFVSLLPGGAGVRELVLVTLLAPRYGLPAAFAAAVVARLAFMVAECVAFMICRFWIPRTLP